MKVRRHCDKLRLDRVPEERPPNLERVLDGEKRKFGARDRI